MDKCGICNGQNINFSAAALATFLASNLTRTEVEILTVFLQSVAQSLSTIVIANDICTENQNTADTGFVIR